MSSKKSTRIASAILRVGRIFAKAPRHQTARVAERDANEGLSLLRNAHRIFIAYSHSDLPAARSFRQRVLRLRRAQAKTSVFLDQDILPPGGEQAQIAIDEALESCDLFVILCGRDTADRLQVNRELKQARHLRASKGLQILPVILNARSRLPAEAQDIQGAFYSSLFPSVKWARNAAISSIAILGIAAASFGVMWAIGFNPQKYVHYRVLSSLSDAEAIAPAHLGKILRDSYGHAWLQRFSAGMLVLPVREEDFTFHQGDSTFNDSLFILRFNGQTGGDWFLQRRPPTKGDLYDRRDFEAMVSGTSPRDDVLQWAAADGLSKEELVSLFMPHAETSAINISGGIALAYAKFRLDKYVGKPIEHTFDGEMLLRVRENGYELSLLPSAKAKPIASGQSPRRGTATYFLVRSRQPEVLRIGDDRVAGGVEIFERGTWTEVDTSSRIEQIARPRQSFVRDLDAATRDKLK